MRMPAAAAGLDGVFGPPRDANGDMAYDDVDRCMGFIMRVLGVDDVVCGVERIMLSACCCTDSGIEVADG